MSNVYDGADFETEAIIIPTVKGIHRELLEENIKNQLENPFVSTTNYVETFNMQIKDIIDEDEDISSDAIKAINNERISFYAEVIGLIDEAFRLECDTDTIMEKDVEEIGDICEAMYDFFITKRKKNIKNMMLNYILRNRDDICDTLDILRKKKDVTTVAVGKAIDDPQFALLITNVQEVLRYVKSLDIAMEDMIEYVDLDLYNNELMGSLMAMGIIRGDFQARYFAPLWGYQDCDYDDIIAKIVHGFEKAYRKKAKKEKKEGK